MPNLSERGRVRGIESLLAAPGFAAVAVSRGAGQLVSGMPIAYPRRGYRNPRWLNRAARR